MNIHSILRNLLITGSLVVLSGTGARSVSAQSAVMGRPLVHAEADSSSATGGFSEPLEDDQGQEENNRAPRGFRWKDALNQSARMLVAQHVFRIATDSDVQANLRGPLFKDYGRSVANLGGWRDGDPLRTNYIAHPLQGAVSGRIQVQNDPRGARERFGKSSKYWKSRLKAMGWSAAYSLQFEIGPLSEAMIGNDGLPNSYRQRKQPFRPKNGGMGWVDLVVTPVGGTTWIVAEDAIDRYVVVGLERKVRNRPLQAVVRTLLNPSRSLANILRAKKPWHRDDRPFLF